MPSYADLVEQLMREYEGRVSLSRVSQVVAECRRSHEIQPRNMEAFLGACRDRLDAYRQAQRRGA